MSTARRPPELMGIKEVCDLTGIPKQTVHSWVTRGSAGIPPHANLAAGPVWRKSDIVAWLKSTGRLDHYRRTLEADAHAAYARNDREAHRRALDGLALFDRI